MLLRLLIPCVLLLSACSSGDSEADIRGIWEAKVTFENEDEKKKSVRLTLSLDQDGDEVTGSFAGDDSSGGAIKGQIDGRTLALIFFQTTPCEGTLNLLATLADEEDDRDFTKFAGTLSGDSCDGELNAAVTATRRTE